MLIQKNARWSWKKSYVRENSKWIELWQKRDITEREYSLSYTLVRVFSPVLETFFLSKLLRAEEEHQQTVYHSCPQDFHSPPSYADSPSDFVSTLGIDLSQGLTQTKLMSVINFFTWELPGKLEYSKFIWPIFPLWVDPYGKSNNNHMVAQ